MVLGLWCGCTVRNDLRAVLVEAQRQQASSLSEERHDPDGSSHMTTALASPRIKESQAHSASGVALVVFRQVELDSLVWFQL
jgi:hypothetical protein